MSQRDLTAELRASRIDAPTELRERVRLIAAADTTPPRSRFTWRRAFVVALPLAAAIIGGVLVTRSSHERSATPATDERAATLRSQTAHAAAPTINNGSVDRGAGSSGAATKLAPAPSGTRVQRYGATLALRLATPKGVSDGVQRALRITASLGGYPTSVHATSARGSATADLTLKVPRTHVQKAITQLSALGLITSERVEVQDVQGGLDQTARTIARLQGQLRDLRSQTQTPAIQRRIAAITRTVEGLQRARADAIRRTRYATIQLHLATPHKQVVPAKHGHGPLHGLGIAFHWIWIGAVYALALGTPLVLLTVLLWLAVRAVRRRREDALLSSP